MIGQQKLVAQIEDLAERNSIPRFSIVVGERGSEQDDVGRIIALKLECPYIVVQDVKVDTIRNMIKEAYTQHEKMVYIIPHADDMSINAKNAMLKVTEEAPNKAYIVMCLDDLSNTLSTIQSRGTVFYMDRCKTDDIKEFARELYVNKSDIDEKIIDMYGELCSTPGDVLYFTKHNISNFYNYAEWVVDNVFIMNGAEAFKVSDKLALKDEEDKYDCLLFLKALQSVFMKKCLYNGFKETGICGTYCACAEIRCISHYLQDLRIKGVNRAMLMDNLILEMRKIWKSQK